MRYQNWKILNHYPKDPFTAILKSRKISDQVSFLEPKYEDLVDPAKVPGLLKACERIFQAQKNQEKVGLFMDYDADGISGGTIIFKTLQILGIKVEPYVPAREDGYGLNKKAIDSFVKLGVNLLITVDCGIRNNDEIAYAKKNKIETIVVDHHQLGDKLPNTFALVHPLITPNKLKFRDFSGGGVAFLLAKQLLKNSPQAKWLLDLAAISSIGDVVPLIGDNRILVKYGLMVLRKTKNAGLVDLYKFAKLEREQIGTYEVGYMIAPRLNAAGRISSPRKSFELLTSTDKDEISALAGELNKINEQRQELLKQAVEQAIKMVAKDKLQQNKIILLKNKNWPEGIIGLVAGKIAQKFWRPTIAMSERGDRIKGSARSIPGVNITKLIGAAEGDLISFGGHEQAAGLALEAKKYEKFAKKIKVVAKDIEDSIFVREITVDAVLEPRQVSLTFAKKIEKMEPFGPGNRRPVIALENMVLERFRHIGRDNKHIRAEFVKDDHKHFVVAFSFEDNGWDFQNGQTYDLLFSVKADTWQGREKLDLILEDAKIVKSEKLVSSGVEK